MEKIILSFVSLFFLAFAHAESPPLECKTNDFQDCLPGLPIDPEDMAGKILPDEAFLNKHCSALIGSMYCIQSLIQVCKEDIIEDSEDANEAVTLGLELLNELCDVDSELRQEYLTGIACINAHSMRFIQCGRNSTEVAGRFLDYLQEQGFEEEEIMTVYRCINMVIASSCVTHEAWSRCNEDVAEGVDEFVTEIVQELKDKICPAEIMDEYLGELLTYVMENPQYFREFMSNMFGM